ncbi:MAG TPA: Minf_1886 family protein [Gemmatimonadales bacterium]
MFQLQLADEIVDQIQARDGRYDPRAYLFVLAALEYCQEHRPVRGHVTGDELAWGCRDFAREQFGLTARSVFGHWGIHSTRDIGHVVYTLIEIGLLIGQPEDRIEDFEEVYQFPEALEQHYPWSGVEGAGCDR